MTPVWAGIALDVSGVLVELDTYASHWRAVVSLPTGLVVTVRGAGAAPEVRALAEWARGCPE